MPKRFVFRTLLCWTQLLFFLQSKQGKLRRYARQTLIICIASQCFCFSSGSNCPYCFWLLILYPSLLPAFENSSISKISNPLKTSFYPWISFSIYSFISSAGNEMENMLSIKRSVGRVYIPGSFFCFYLPGS